MLGPSIGAPTDWMFNAPFRALGLLSIAAIVAWAMLLPLGHPASWFNFEERDPDR